MISDAYRLRQRAGRAAFLVSSHMTRGTLPPMYVQHHPTVAVGYETIPRSLVGAVAR